MFHGIILELMLNYINNRENEFFVSVFVLNSDTILYLYAKNVNFKCFKCFMKCLCIPVAVLVVYRS